MTRPDLLLLHGALGAGDQFSALLPLLGMIGKVHTPDFEGHGQAESVDRPFRAEYFVENIIRYLEDNDLSVVDIFGYSMGGFVGLCLARLYSDRVRRIFTFATKFHWTPDTAAREASYLDPDILLQKAPEFAHALEIRHSRCGWKTVLAKTKEMTLRLCRESLLSEADFRLISQPARLTMGDRDKMVSLEETIATFRLLPNAQLQIFPATPHPIEQVSSETLATAMTHYFK